MSDVYTTQGILGNIGSRVQCDYYLLLYRTGLVSVVLPHEYKSEYFLRVRP